MSTQTDAPVVTYRAATLPLRRAVVGEVGSHFFKGDCHTHAGRSCPPRAYRDSSRVGYVLLCDHGRIQQLPAGTQELLDALRSLPYWAPLCR